jgi:hypothetical protein
MSPFDRCVRLFPPSLQWVPWPPLAGPAVPHLHRYYGVIRLLHHPSLPPLVDPRGHRYPPLLHCERRWRALLGSWTIPVEACPGLETPAIPARPRYIGHYRMLPSARLTASASQPGKISELNPRGLLPRCVRFAPTSRPVNGNTHY